jgi:hypothetical protein
MGKESRIQELTAGSHSYRNFNPAGFWDELPRGGPPSNEDREVVHQSLQFIESGRFEPLLEALSDFFFKLDTDEMRLFTRRNPDVVEWMGVWNKSKGLNSYREMVELAQESLSPGREHAPDAAAFERKQLSEDTLLKDMAFRRRSYRNWTPQEFREIIENDPYELSPGMLAELDIYTAEAREDIDSAIEVAGRQVSRKLLERVEAGRFEPVLSEAHNFFSPLDPDERRMFARRNPGLLMWVSAYGFSHHLIHGEQLFPRADDFFPTLPEI